jgi:hypothetical protein
VTDDSLRARLEARRTQPPGDPLEVSKAFVARFWADTGTLEAVREELEGAVRRDRLGVERGVQALDALLADPPSPRTLVMLVADEGNTPLDEATDEEAAGWLRTFADAARDALRPR